MGGERETVAEQRVQPEIGGDPVVVGTVRYHENKGQIHFHDDANKLKVAIPVSVWYRAWGNMCSSLPSEFHYADPDEGTVLHVALKLKKANPKKKRDRPQLDVLLHVEKLDMTEHFSKLNKFSAK